MAYIDIKPGNKPKIIERFINGLRILNLSLEMQYATDKMSNVEIMQTKTETINVLSIHLGKAYL